jgi:hypothetical protein
LSCEGEVSLCLFLKLKVLLLIFGDILFFLSSEASREFGMEAHMLVRLPSLLRGWLNEGRYSEEWCTVLMPVCLSVSRALIDSGQE